MIGVDPLHSGIASFHAMFSSVVHLAGRFFSLLMPLSEGPRHCGQFSAWTATASSRTTINRLRARNLMTPPSHSHRALARCCEATRNSETGLNGFHFRPICVPLAEARGE